MGRMRQGNVVGQRACEEFPGGVLIDLPYDDYDEKIEATRKALADGAPAIFEASFREDGVFVAVDVLERVDDGYNVIEVKASNETKDKHIPDVAVQAHVVRAAGLDVRRCEVMTLNRDHRHPDVGTALHSRGRERPRGRHHGPGSGGDRGPDRVSSTGLPRTLPSGISARVVTAAHFGAAAGRRSRIP